MTLLSVTTEIGDNPGKWLHIRQLADGVGGARPWIDGMAPHATISLSVIGWGSSVLVVAWKFINVQQFTVLLVAACDFVIATDR